MVLTLFALWVALIDELYQRRRSSSIPVIRVVLPPPVRRELLGRAAGDHLVERGFLIARLAEDTPQPLNVLADRARARKHDRDIGLGDVDPFVQDA